MDPQGWRITAIFFATIAGLMLQPLPGSQVVLIGITALILVGRVPMARALEGYSAASVWMVLAAMMMSRALRDCGLARRIALQFVRAIGNTSLGLGYALHLTDLTLATGVPSITARSASIVFPIAPQHQRPHDRSPAHRAPPRHVPDDVHYQTSVSPPRFFLQHASHLLLGDLAREYAGIEVTWTSWFIAGLVPGLVSSVAVPLLVLRAVPPEIRRTPAARDFAQRELDKLGPIRGTEAIVAVVFVFLIAFWVLSSYVDWLSPGLVAFIGLSVLFVSQALTWNAALGERSAWDIFVWYGGLLTMGGLLNESGSPTVFATWVGSAFEGCRGGGLRRGPRHLLLRAPSSPARRPTRSRSTGRSWRPRAVGGRPPSSPQPAFINNLTAGLTHYGTTTSPIIFARLRDFRDLAHRLLRLRAHLVIGSRGGLGGRSRLWEERPAGGRRHAPFGRRHGVPGHAATGARGEGDSSGCSLVFAFAASRRTGPATWLCATANYAPVSPRARAFDLVIRGAVRHYTPL